jgi:hypothetical protein
MKVRRGWVVTLPGFLRAVQSSLAAEYKSAREAVEKGRALCDKGDDDKAVATFFVPLDGT